MSTYKDKKVFLTGHSGFKGTWLYKILETLGSDVFGYSLAPITNPNHFDLLGGKDSFSGLFADIMDKHSLQDSLLSFNPHIIFHLAAQSLVRESYKNPYETFEINSLGILNLLYTIYKLKDKLSNLKAVVIITTDKVYENKECIWGYRENDRLGGFDPYSASKACGEIIVDSMRRSFFNIADFGNSHNVLIATARAGNVIGGGDFNKDRLIPDLVRGVINKKPTIIRNPLSTRPWQSVLEPLRGYLFLGKKLLQGDVEFASSFNFGPDISGNLQVLEMLEIAKSIWNKIEYKIQEDSLNPHEANLLMLDTSKAYHLLKYKPVLNTIDSIAHTITWYKKFIEDREIITQKQIVEYLNGGGRSHNLNHKNTTKILQKNQNYTKIKTYKEILSLYSSSNKYKINYSKYAA